MSASYEYRYHDGVLLRRAPSTPMTDIEMCVSASEWKPFPEPSDKDIGSSSIAAWMEGTPVSEADAEELLQYI